MNSNFIPVFVLIQHIYLYIYSSYLKYFCQNLRIKRSFYSQLD